MKGLGRVDLVKDARSTVDLNFARTRAAVPVVLSAFQAYALCPVVASHGMNLCSAPCRSRLSFGTAEVGEIVSYTF